MKQSQCQKVIDHLNQFGGITSLEAIKIYGITRLASRITDLRKKGYPIADKWVQVTTRNGEKTRVKCYIWDEVCDEVPQQED